MTVREIINQLLECYKQNLLHIVGDSESLEEHLKIYKEKEKILNKYMEEKEELELLVTYQVYAERWMLPELNKKYPDKHYIYESPNGIAVSRELLRL